MSRPLGETEAETRLDSLEAQVVGASGGRVGASSAWLVATSKASSVRPTDPLISFVTTNPECSHLVKSFQGHLVVYIYGEDRQRISGIAV